MLLWCWLSLYNLLEQTTSSLLECIGPSSNGTPACLPSCGSEQIKRYKDWMHCAAVCRRAICALIQTSHGSQTQELPGYFESKIAFNDPKLYLKGWGNLPFIKQPAVKYASWIKSKMLIYIHIRCVLMFKLP